MAAWPGKLDREPVAVGHEDTGTHQDGAGRRERVHVDGERRGRTGEPQIGVFKERERPAIGLFSRLEGQHGVAARRMVGQHLGGAEEHGHVQVVTAGVHRALVK